jgi:hypothetical protein
MQTNGEKMNFFKNLFQRLFFNADGNERLQSFVSPDSNKAKPNLQRFVQANSKSGELTQDQLAEVLRWLSLH